MDLAELIEISQQEHALDKPVQIRCCVAAGCLSANSASVKQRLIAAIARENLTQIAEVRGVGCMRLCCQCSLVEVEDNREKTINQATNLEVKSLVTLYEQVTPDDALAIIRGLEGEEISVKKGDLNHPFFAMQMPIVLENSGKINPERIQSYIAASGYRSLYHVLREMTPSEVVTIHRSGLRGRGGAGYPTGLKWGTVAKAKAECKFVICNPDEGDPGAFMDRSVLESDPHRVLEGMAIAAYAVGASQGYIYIRAEYPIAIQRLQTAIRQGQRFGILGSQIFDSRFDFKGCIFAG